MLGLEHKALHVQIGLCPIFMVFVLCLSNTTARLMKALKEEVKKSSHRI